MAGKKGMKWAPKIKSPTNIEQLRISIEAYKLVEALKKHTLGEKEMSPSQVTAGLGLIRKVLPDMTVTEHSGESTIRIVDADEARAEMLGRLARRSTTDGEDQSAGGTLQ